MLANCKSCGKEIAKGVRKCVNCGADQRNFFSRHKIITGILALVIIGGISAAMRGGSGSSITTAPVSSTPAPAVVKNGPTMTMSEFTQLKDGMSYEEATKIIGGPGEVMSESGAKGDDLHTVMYQYKGEGSLGANANIMFQGNKLNTKAQMGLK